MFNRSKTSSIQTPLLCVGFWLVTSSSLVFGQSSVSAENEPMVAESIGSVVSCAVCHGSNGEGNVQMSAPRIGGMSEAYLSTQLQNFRQGIRGDTYEDVYGTQMRAMAMALDNEDEVNELARYFSTLSPPPAPSSIEGDIERGKQLYAVCSACHGVDGDGNEQMNSPSLKGQYDWYLVRQLKHYKNGLRGANKSDTLGQQMVPMALTLPDEQAVKDVVAYINSL